MPLISVKIYCEKICRVILLQWIDADERVAAQMRTDNVVREWRIFTGVKFRGSISRFSSSVARPKSCENIISSSKKRSKQPELVKSIKHLLACDCRLFQGFLHIERIEEGAGCRMELFRRAHRKQVLTNHGRSSQMRR